MGETEPNPAYLRLLAAAEASPILLELVQLHATEPEYVRHDGSVSGWVCCGDDARDAADWPCSTIDVIARHLGVNLSPAVFDVLPVRAVRPPHTRMPEGWSALFPERPPEPPRSMADQVRDHLRKS